MFHFLVAHARAIYILVATQRWDDLKEYQQSVREILALKDDSAALGALSESMKVHDDALAAAIAANQPTPASPPL